MQILRLEYEIQQTELENTDVDSDEEKLSVAKSRLYTASNIDSWVPERPKYRDNHEEYTIYGESNLRKDEKTNNAGTNEILNKLCDSIASPV